MIGDALRSLRQDAGLTQEALAERAGMSVRGLRKLEASLVASPRRATLEALADALDLTGDPRSIFVRGQDPGRKRTATSSAAWVPRQLPPRLTCFVGRTTEMTVLDEALSNVTIPPGSPRATSVVTLSGPPGVGKTALATEWGHRATSLFPDGQLYINLRGFDVKNAPLSADEALWVLLTSLGVPDADVRAGLESRVGQYRTQISKTRTLVILDNAANSDQVRPLVPAGEGSAALVTSRQRLTGLVAEVGALPISVGMLRPDESLELISSRLSLGTGTAESDAASMQPLVDICSGLPLALAIVASRAQFEPEVVADHATTDPRSARGMSIVSTADRAMSFDALLLGSMAALSDAARTCLVSIGLGATSELSLAEIASLCGCDRTDARARVEELVDASLIQTVGARFVLHDLIWAFVVDRARSCIASDEAEMRRKRLLEYLIHGTVAATATFAPYWKRPDLSAPADGVVVEEFTDSGEAREWMGSVLNGSLAAISHGVSWGLARETAWLADGISAYLDIQGRWEDLAMAATAALRAGDSLNDPQIQALAYRRLAIAQGRTGELGLAAQSLRRVLGFYSDNGDQEGEGYAHRLLGNILNELGEQEAALDHRRQALRLFETLGDEAAQTRALNAVGWSHAQLGDFMVALDYCTRSAEMADLLKHSRSVAAAWDSIGFIKHAMRDLEGAAEAYERALVAWRDTGERYYEAETLVRLGELRVDSGDQRGAVDALRSALVFYEELGLSQADGVRTRLSDLGDRPDSAPRPAGADAECAPTASTSGSLVPPKDNRQTA